MRTPAWSVEVKPGEGWVFGLAAVNAVKAEWEDVAGRAPGRVVVELLPLQNDAVPEYRLVVEADGWLSARNVFVANQSERGVLEVLCATARGMAKAWADRRTNCILQAGGLVGA